MKFYLAARYSRREELAGYAEQLRELGHEVTSRWLDGSHEVGADGLSEEAPGQQRRRFAEEDWADLRAAEVVINFTEPSRSTASRGGRHVEFGAALAWGKLVHVVGHRENVFHCLGQVAFWETWLDLLIALRTEEAERQLLDAKLRAHYACSRCGRCCPPIFDDGTGHCDFCHKTVVPGEAEALDQTTAPDGTGLVHVTALRAYPHSRRQMVGDPSAFLGGLETSDPGVDHE